MTIAKALFKFFSSLRLTVWLLVASLVLVFFGTLDQVHLGIFVAQEKYFQSIIATWGYPEQWPWGQYLKHVYLPIPGGYLVGFMMLANLACAHFKYFRHRWSNAGIVMIHAGLALLLISELLTHITREEHYLWFEEGQTTRHLTSYHLDEIVVIDRSSAEADHVVAFPANQLTVGTALSHASLPFNMRVIRFHENATLSRGGQVQALAASRGLAASMGLVVQAQPMTFRTNERNTTTAVVDIQSAEGSLGTWLVSNVLENGFPPQTFEYEGKTYEISLRYTRRYLPFSMKLHKFSHDRYPGTNIPRNFASRIQLQDESAAVDREALIYMNNPLRYGGYTFYQSSFGADSMGREDRASQLQAVSNPSWLMPYIACTLMTIGLAWQFSYGLSKYLTRNRNRTIAISNS